MTGSNDALLFQRKDRAYSSRSQDPMVMVALALGHGISQNSRTAMHGVFKFGGKVDYVNRHD